MTVEVYVFCQILRDIQWKQMEITNTSRTTNSIHGFFLSFLLFHFISPALFFTSPPGFLLKSARFYPCFAEWSLKLCRVLTFIHFCSKSHTFLSKHRGVIQFCLQPCKVFWQRSDLNCVEAEKVDFNPLWNYTREREDVFKLHGLYWWKIWGEKMEDLNYKRGST